MMHLNMEENFRERSARVWWQLRLKTMTDRVHHLLAWYATLKECAQPASLAKWVMHLISEAYDGYTYSQWLHF